MRSFKFPKGRYLVAGAGITGEAVVAFLLDEGCECIVFEELDEKKLDKLKEKFKGQKCSFYFGKFPDQACADVKGFFVSPGIPLNRQWVQMHQNIPVLGELEFASQFLEGSIIAVTGTNGKSTTVSLIDAIIKEGGFQSSLKGNIGSPLVTALRESPKDYYVVEVSSYQLETIKTFRPKVSVMLNVTADHLDRYDSMQGYADAKARIFENQKEDDVLIYNADDSYCLRAAQKAKCCLMPFSLVNSFDEGGFVEKNEMVIRWQKKEYRYRLADCSLKGLHNQENMLASILAVTVCGMGSDKILNTLKSFKALSHRVQNIGTFRGMAFYDDSKGTNVGAVVMSLASFEKNVFLILGGRDKGGDYLPLKSLIEPKVKGLIILGEAKEKINKALGGLVPTYVVENMQEAVKVSYEHGSPGDTVLLSPACSSFDQYQNYAQRGDDFKKWVNHYANLQ